VTGTKGKSTTSALIHHVLAENGFDALLVGNIGIPALNHIDQITSKSKVVIEMSSHQLEQLTISPDIAVIQEITSEHLDYFPNEQVYVDSKKSISIYQKVNQYIIYNPEWQKTTKIAQLSPGIQLKFQINASENSNNNDVLVYLKSYYLTFNHNNVEEQIINIKDIPLLGRHNLENVAPSIMVGKMFGLSRQQIASAIKSFTPLPHRLQKVAVKNGVTYVNDSMATTPESAISAISCFDDQPIILLAGGHEKNQDFTQLAEKILTANVKAVALFPANGPRLWKEVLQKQKRLKLKTMPKHRVVHSMDEAIEFAKDNAQPGDVVLLAPGSASFGIFKDYADRGGRFSTGI
jgi:UDP-N-acetylmuramoyl-L-alanine---L-glutamate ligase